MVPTHSEVLLMRGHLRNYPDPFAFSRYAARPFAAFAAFAHPFDPNFNLSTLPARILVAAVHCWPLTGEFRHLADSRCQSGTGQSVATSPASM